MDTKIEEQDEFVGWWRAETLKRDGDFLKSRDAALTLSLAEKIAATDKDKKYLVFAPNKMLLPLGVEHAPLPCALYRFEKG